MTVAAARTAGAGGGLAAWDAAGGGVERAAVAGDGPAPRYAPHAPTDASAPAQPAEPRPGGAGQPPAAQAHPAEPRPGGAGQPPAAQAQAAGPCAVPARPAQGVEAVVCGLDAAQLLAAAGLCVSRLAAEPLSGAVDDATLAASVEALYRLQTRVAAERLRRIAAVDDRQAYRSQGCASTVQLLAERCALTRGQARSDTETAAGLQTLPRTADRLARGQLGVEQAREATRAAAGLDALAGRDPDGQGDEQTAAALRDELDELAADHTQGLNRQQVRDKVTDWRHTVDERFLADREQQAYARRQLRVGVDGRDGSVVGGFRLHPDGGALVAAALEPLARPSGSEDDRSREQRLADALVTLCERQLNAGALPEVAAQRPHVILIATVEALHGMPGAAPARLDGVGPVSSATARMLACDGHVTELVVDAQGRPLAVTETGRPTRSQRLAVIGRDGQCIGCGAPATRCQIHHVVWRRHGGATVAENLVLVCYTCHRNIHHHSWDVVRRRGRYRLRPPRDAASDRGGCGRHRR